MPASNLTNETRTLTALRKEWGVLALAAFLALASGWLVLRSGWGAEYALRWLIAASLVTVYAFAHLWYHLGENRRREQCSPLFADLGIANRLTFARAILNAMLVGFLFGPWPWGWLAWVPAGLYIASALMDYLDGYAARVTGRTSVLGESLDMKWDGVGLLAAGTLSVLYGQTPSVYLLVGFARYLYLFGMWVHQRRGLPVYDLPPSRFRRAMAGTQMGFVAVVLLPIFRPPETHLAAVLFGLPLLAGFARDYLWVTGVLGRRSAAAPRSANPKVLQLALRGLLVALLVHLLAHLATHSTPQIGLMLVAAAAVPAVLLGAAGRAAALAVLLMTGFGLQADPLEWRYWLLLPASTLLFFTGTGAWSLWRPEEWLIDHRAGEAREG